MKLHTRIDSNTASHVRFTLFINGANTGQLCFRLDEFTAWDITMTQAFNSPLDEYRTSGKITEDKDA
jgi:hypothetical protein